MAEQNNNNQTPPNNKVPNPDYQKKIQDIDKHIQTLDSNIPSLLRQSTSNPYVQARSYTFNPESTTDQNKNFERYYSHSSFEKLGWNPWADNETLYNEKGTKAGDIWRATKAAGKLALTGFVSPLRSYGDILTGNAFAPDYESGKEMSYYNAVGSSSRGGLTGFTSNLLTNSGYTFGIIGEMAAESFLLSAVTGDAAAGGALAVGKIGKFGKDFGKFTTAVKGINNTVKAFKDYGVAKAGYEALKAGVKFVNPLENTTAAAISGYKALKNSENLVDLAKGSKTAGAFFRDVMVANASLSEAKMEGAVAQKDLESDLLSRFRATHDGKEPSKEEMDQIKEAASDAGVKTTAWNIPTIFLTNKITFAPLLKSFTKPSEYVLRNGVKFIEKEGEGLVEANFKNRLAASLKPKNLLIAPLRYFKENFSEGFQETAQEIISGTAKDYYKDLYNTAAKHGVDYAVAENRSKGVWDALSSNVADQFTGKGFETFASGFLMGGLIKVAGAPFRAATSTYQEYKKQKNEYAAKSLASLNEIYKDPLKFFSPGIINFANGTEAVKGQTHAERKGNVKEWMDHEDSNLTSQVMTALETNTYDIFLDKLRSIKTMDPQAIKDAYGYDGKQVLSKIDKIVSRAERVKDNYEKWSERYENPFNPNAFEKGSSEYNKAALGYVSWENAKKLAIFNDTSFARNSERIQSLTTDILETGDIKKIKANDISLLFTPSAIRNELKQLDDEIEVLNESLVSSDRPTLNQKKSKRKKLQDVLDRLEGYYVGQQMDKLSPEAKKAFGEFKKTNREQLKRSYNDYLSFLSTSQTETVHLSDMDIERSFQDMLDLHELKQENFHYARAINVLADPHGFTEQVDRLNKNFTDMYNAREESIKKAIEFAHSKIEDNTVLTALHTRGFVLSPEDAEKLLKNKTIPDQFYDINAKQVVDKRDPIRYGEFQDIIKNYVQATKPDVEQTKEAEPQPQSKQTKTEPEKEAASVHTPLNVDAEKMFSEVKTGEQLDNVMSELMTVIATSTARQRAEIGLTSEKITELAKAKEEELQLKLDIANINVGDILAFNDEKEGNALVKFKGKNSITVQIVGDPNSKIIVDQQNLKKTFRYKFTETMSKTQPKATAEDVQKAQKNTETQDKILSNKDLVEALVKEGLENKTKAQEEFLAELGCK